MSLVWTVGILWSYSSWSFIRLEDNIEICKNVGLLVIKM